jgi:hypothetical protein
LFLSMLPELLKNSSNLRTSVVILEKSLKIQTETQALFKLLIFKGKSFAITTA